MKNANLKFFALIISAAILIAISSGVSLFNWLILCGDGFSIVYYDNKFQDLLKDHFSLCFIFCFNKWILSG